jgi:Nif-specific regulatory protein
MATTNLFDLRAVLEGIERDIILTALRDTHGNKARAARALGLTERLMGIRVRKLGIDWRAFRASR